MRWLGCKGASCGKYNHILCAPGSTLHVCDPEELHSVNVRIRVNWFSYYCWVIQCLQSDHHLWMSPCLHSSFWKRPLRFRWEQIMNCMRVDVRPNSLLSFPRHTWQRVASASRVPGVLLWISSLSLSAPSLPPGTHSILFPPLLPSNFLYLSVCLSVCAYSFCPGCWAACVVPDLSFCHCGVSCHHQNNCRQSPETFSQTTVCLLSPDT